MTDCRRCGRSHRYADEICADGLPSDKGVGPDCRQGAHQRCHETHMGYQLCKCGCHAILSADDSLEAEWRYVAARLYTAYKECDDFTGSPDAIRHVHEALTLYDQLRATLSDAGTS